MADAGSSPVKRRRLSSVLATKSENLPNVNSETVRVQAGGLPVPRSSVSPLGVPTSQQTVEEGPSALGETRKIVGQDGVTGFKAPLIERGEVSNIHVGDHNSADRQTEEEPRYPEKIFLVHKGVLCKTSRFLQAATKPEWKGSGPRPVDLSPEDPKLVEQYIQWLYTRRVVVETYKSKRVDDNGVAIERIAQPPLIKSYILGERLIDADYQNEIIRILILSYRHEGTFPAITTTRMVYEATTETSPLRALFVDIWVWAATDPWLPRDLETVGLEFAADILNAMTTKRMSPAHALQAAKEYKTNPAKLEAAAMAPWVVWPEKYEIRDAAMSGPHRPSGIWGFDNEGKFLRIN